jgi:hypothetical protein
MDLRKVNGIYFDAENVENENVLKCLKHGISKDLVCLLLAIWLLKENQATESKNSQLYTTKKENQIHTFLDTTRCC